MRKENKQKIWIEPYWNVKSVTFASYLPSCHLNRTILECKGNCLSVSSISNFNLNRTILECKADKYPDTIEGVIIWIEPYWNVKFNILPSIFLEIFHLNRTILECKTLCTHVSVINQLIWIEPYWNVKLESTKVLSSETFIWIEPYWNVKYPFIIFFSNKFYLNRTILECKKILL